MITGAVAPAMFVDAASLVAIFTLVRVAHNLTSPGMSNESLQFRTISTDAISFERSTPINPLDCDQTWLAVIVIDDRFPSGNPVLSE